MGRRRTETFERLYLLPGVYHCSGGEGPSLVDLLTPVIDWVEKGVAPDAVIARSPGARKAARSRPVFPYPAPARYDGKGDPNEASSYVRGAPLTAPRLGRPSGLGRRRFLHATARED